jgi:hypothetical protein
VFGVEYRVTTTGVHLSEAGTHILPYAAVTGHGGHKEHYAIFALCKVSLKQIMVSAVVRDHGKTKGTSLRFA